VKTHKSMCWRPVALSGCLIGAVTVMLSVALAGCSFSHTTEPTNANPLSYLRSDIEAAGITSVEGSEGDDELYLEVLPVEGQDPSATAEKLLSLAQKYRKQFGVHRLRVVIRPTYDHTFDFGE
jgi:hypothetical protein